MRFLDRSYRFEGPRPKFHRVPGPTPAELARLLHIISHRIARLLERQRLLVRDAESDYLDFEPGEALESAEPKRWMRVTAPVLAPEATVNPDFLIR